MIASFLLVKSFLKIAAKKKPIIHQYEIIVVIMVDSFFFGWINGAFYAVILEKVYGGIVDIFI